MSFKFKLFLVLGVLIFTPGCDDDDDSGTPDAHIDDILALTGDSTAGATVYSNTCATCHGADGSGGSGPALTSEMSEQSDEEFVSIVLYGEDRMPAQSQLSDQEIADVLSYCRDTFGAGE